MPGRVYGALEPLCLTRRLVRQLGAAAERFFVCGHPCAGFAAEQQAAVSGLAGKVQKRFDEEFKQDAGRGRARAACQSWCLIDI
jgi:hypothetical protein